ncbi:MAG: phosphate ABC transporter substrate-binding protein, partial [Okeania sp. SIO2H7]|nr:phosphate ABC transporter substrate-binding protein [Okeania sp. SIO2H7]
SGGIAGVKDKAIDIGVISREITATQNTDNIQYLAIASSPLLLITNETVEGVANLNAEQIRAIYSGEITNWQELGGPDAEIIILDIPEDENEKKVLREHYLGEELNVTPKAVIFAEDDEILEAAASTPFSIGPIALSKEVEELPVNILTLDGVAPTVANINTGKYKLTQTIGIVFRSETTDAVGDFVDFIQSEEAKPKLEEAGYVVLNNS